jgi:hypothetical protein
MSSQDTFQLLRLTSIRWMSSPSFDYNEDGLWEGMFISAEWAANRRRERKTRSLFNPILSFILESATFFRESIWQLGPLIFHARFSSSEIFPYFLTAVVLLVRHWDLFTQRPWALLSVEGNDMGVVSGQRKGWHWLKVDWWIEKNIDWKSRKMAKIGPKSPKQQSKLRWKKN